MPIHDQYINTRNLNSIYLEVWAGWMKNMIIIVTEDKNYFPLLPQLYKRTVVHLQTPWIQGRGFHGQNLLPSRFQLSKCNHWKPPPPGKLMITQESRYGLPGRCPGARGIILYKSLGIKDLENRRIAHSILPISVLDRCLMVKLRCYGDKGHVSMKLNPTGRQGYIWHLRQQVALIQPPRTIWTYQGSW